MCFTAKEDACADRLASARPTGDQRRSADPYPITLRYQRLAATADATDSASKSKAFAALVTAFDEGNH
uniref:Lipoprotein n=1 Tax=Steinernema glaseri TaxID=37863 RepID=A0A1I7ZEG9_9BILA